ncbi:hypothetical protein PCANC_04684 [Puccinia coronata f. sp. avenae]|uniref:Uncharacterized protein n=1 Tax=Puccinia coronata f. sp. avenae TaxID=200324 RepID=A0A2N5W1H8_9BASI|nr:hypothetical protein PCANC_04684 [Puccinia coronata f. sp. avenae]
MLRPSNRALFQLKEKGQFNGVVPQKPDVCAFLATSARLQQHPSPAAEQLDFSSTSVKVNAHMNTNSSRPKVKLNKDPLKKISAPGLNLSNRPEVKRPRGIIQTNSTPVSP